MLMLRLKLVVLHWHQRRDSVSVKEQSEGKLQTRQPRQ
jgi:hypothetical protein